MQACDESSCVAFLKAHRHRLVTLFVGVFIACAALLPGGAARATTFCGVTLPPEIVTQAAALKNDPDLIYEYVYNNIKTVPQYGSLKGALGTLLDGAGTPVDQAELMASLLQAAGYTTAKYQTGNIAISAGLLTDWLGTDNSPYSAYFVMADGGFAPTIVSNTSGTQMLYLVVPWAWVKVQIGGTDYVFDPAAKATYWYSRSSGISNIASTALGYSQSSFLSAAEAGATINPTDISGLNRSNVRINLRTYSQNLVSYIKTNNPSASTADIIGGTSIVPLTPGTHQRITSLDYEMATPTDHTCLPGSLRTTVSLTVPGASAVTFNTSDIYGHRLSLFFDSGIRPVLRLDGAVQATGSAASSGDQVVLTTSITHPYLSNTGVNVSNNQQLKVTASAGGAFLVSNGWGPVGRGMVEKHRLLLQQNAAQNPGNADAESVLGESLSMIGYTWLAENAQAQAVIDQLAGTVTLNHHAVGIVGIKPVGNSTGPFLDLPMNMFSFVQRNSRPNSAGLTPIESAAYFTTTHMVSILESGVLEQTQPGAVAVSTAKLIDIASANETIYDINNSAISGDDCSAYGGTGGARSQLSSTWSYTAPGGGNPPGGDLGAVDTLVDYWPTPACSTSTKNKRVIAPLTGNRVVNGLWTGVGYYRINQAGDSIGALITGGLSGGEPASEVDNTALNNNTAVSVNASANSFISSVTGATSAFFGKVADPTNRVTGSFTYSRTDLTIGSAPFPLGLAFERSYDSSVYLKSTPLGPGWTHNLALTARADSDGFEGMGANSPINGASAIATLYVVQDILNLVTSNEKPLERIVIANQAVAWLMEQLTGNVVVVTQPENVSSFVLLADGTYNPPFGSADTLTSSSGAYTLTGKDGTVIAFNGPSASAPGAIASWHSPAGPTVSYAYDATTGNLTSVSTGTGASGTNRTLTLTYSANQLASVSDGTGRSASYAYDSNGNLTQSTDPAGNVTTYAYDPDNPGRMTRYFNPSFPSTAFITNTYDALGRVTSQTDANGNTTNLYFAGTRTEMVDAVGNSRILYFSARGKALIELDALGYPTVHSYDGLDRLTRSTFPEGNSVGYTYDSRNNPLTITTTPWPGSGLSAVQQVLTYDPAWNKVATSTDPRGIVSRYSYDATTGNLIQTVADYGGAGHFNATRRYTYNSRGQVLTATDAQGIVTQYSYDSTNGNLGSVVADYGGAGHLNQTTAFAYDSVGNVTAQTDPNGNTTTSAYDALRRKTTVTAPAPFNTGANLVQTSFGYDADGHVTSVSRSNGASSQFTSTTYNPIGQVATRTDPSGNVTRYFYDANARLQKLTDALGRSTSYTYNARSQLATVVDATGTTAEQYTYYANGPVAYFMDARGNLTFYGRDGFDRVLSTTYAYGTGRQSTEYFAYDANDNPVTRWTRAGEAISFSYDNLNRRTAMTPPAGTPSISYAYDLAGRLTGVSSDGPSITGPVPPSGGTVQYATIYNYDQLNRPIAVSWNPVPTQTTPTQSSVTFTHGYNVANQRVSQSVTDNTWLGVPGAAWSVSYTVNALNQYTAVNAVSPSYDANGNLVVADFFDAVPTATAGTTNYVTDPDKRVVLEYNGSTGAILRWYAYGLGSNEVLNRMDVAAGTRQTIIPDIQGSTIATLDSSGTLTKRGYLPFGEGGTSSGAFAYTGQYLDASGLYNYRARVYSPGLGRFLQPDPIGEQGRANFYRYVDNDPLNLTDPEGLAAEAAKDLGRAFMRNLEVSIDALTRDPLGQLEKALQGLTPQVGVASAAIIGGVRNLAAGTARVEAQSAASAANLAKQLASQQGVAELLSGGGRVIGGAGTKTPIRDVARLVSEYGGTPGDWVKITSTAPGRLQTHAYRNAMTGRTVELKSIP